MKKVLFFFIAAGLILACGQTETASNTSSTTAKAKKIASKTPPKIDGKKIYKQYCRHPEDRR